MSGPNKQPGYLLRAPSDEIEAWKDAAAEAGETLAKWLRKAAQQRIENEPPREGWWSGGWPGEPPAKNKPKPRARKAKRG